jgi:hypothetical protein
MRRPSLPRWLALFALPLALIAACGGATTGGAAPIDGGYEGDAPGDAAACPDGGTLMPFCSNGVVETSCCPAGAHCAPIPSYCDHGDGTCTLGTCPADGGPVDATPGTGCHVDGDCHKSNPDECTICVDTRLVCYQGSCVCACQVPG